MAAAAAVEAHKFAQCISCHAWSPDQSMIAFCPNNEEVHIYGKLDGKWEKIHVLQKFSVALIVVLCHTEICDCEACIFANNCSAFFSPNRVLAKVCMSLVSFWPQHDQIVSAIDWSKNSNRIVTVSHDRNSYVWNLESSEWVPTLVILRLNRAALCVQWSPLENKFAVGSGAKTVCICYYEQDNNWWVSKLIRKRHNSSVTGVAWHPNNILLATTSTDGKCRVFSTFIKGVDPKELETGSSDSKFGEQIIQLDLSYSWAFGVKWSPSGNTLAYVGHNSMIYFVDDVGPSPLAQNVALRDLPLRDVLFVSEKIVIGVGFDCNPMVFAADESGLWNFVKFLDERRMATPSNARQGSQISEAFGKLYGQSRYSFNSDGLDNSKQHGSIHENCIKFVSFLHLLLIQSRLSLLLYITWFNAITYISHFLLETSCIVPLKNPGDSIIKRFTTSGLDGKVVIWDVSNDEDLAEYM
ncbi:hypothetical protein V2J09_020934 [Rumex salicifolius]